MKISEKTKSQLIEEVVELRRRVAELEAQPGVERGAQGEQSLVEELCKKIVASSPIWFWAANTEATEIYLASQGAKTITGYEPGDFLDTPKLWFELILDEDKPQVVEANERARLEKVPTSYECRLRHKDGAIRWMYVVVIPHSDSDGQLQGVCGFAVDVTDRKRAEEAAREIETLYQQLVGQAGDAIAALDLEGRITAWNPGAERLFGWKAEEVVGRPLSELPSYKEPKILDDVLRWVHAGETVSNVEARRIHKDGAEFDSLLTVSPVYDKSTGELVGSVGILKDITERKQAEEELRFLKEFSENVVQSIQDGLAVMDKDLRITFWNSAMENISGYSAEEVLGRVASDIFPHVKGEGLDELFRRALSGEVVSRSAIPYTTPKGKTGYTNEKFFPFRNQSGEVMGGLVIVEEVTELQSLKRRVANLKDEIEQRKVVEVGKGILMRELDLTEAEAYRYIQKKSQDDKRKMAEVAHRVIEVFGSAEERNKFT